MSEFLEFRTTSHAWKRSWTSEAADAIGVGGPHRFGPPGYGPAIESIFLVYCCVRDKERWNPRFRLDNRAKTLYLDVMLDYELMIQGGMKARMEHILDVLYEDVPLILAKYRRKNLDALRFISDFRTWTESKRSLLNGPIPPEPVDDWALWMAESAIFLPVTIIVTADTKADPSSMTGEALMELGLEGRPKHFPRTVYGDSILEIFVAFHCAKTPRDKEPDDFSRTRMLAVRVDLDYKTMDWTRWLLSETKMLRTLQCRQQVAQEK